MSTIPVAYFCHHKDLEVPPHLSYALRPTEKHPCLLALKINFMRESGGFGPFFLLVDSEATKQACAHLEAEDVHAVVIPETYPDAPPNFNRRLWNMYHPRNDGGIEAFHFAAYATMKGLNIPVLVGDIAHTQPVDQNTLDYIRCMASTEEFELGVAFTELDCPLHIYTLNSLHAYFSTPQKIPYSVYYTCADNIPHPKIYFSPKGTLKSTVTKIQETRLISQTMYDWWSNQVDSMNEIKLEGYIATVLKNAPVCDDVVLRAEGLEELRQIRESIVTNSMASITGRATVIVFPGSAVSMNEFYSELYALRKLPAHIHLMVPNHLLHTISTQLMDVIDVLELEFTCEKSDELFNSLDSNTNFGIGFTNLVNYCKKNSVILGISLLAHPTDPLDTVYFFKGWSRLLTPSLLTGAIKIDGPQFIDYIKLNNLSTNVLKI